ncbi:hypothetical protein FQA39_LY15390 [Lamprigera yunnana]|nr:hypothetical protein FQA39_LY15390 [Lamprigera yunnana]
MLLVLLTGLFAVLFYFKVVKKYNFWHDRGVPYIKPIYFVGNFGPTIFRIKSIHQILRDAYNKYPNSRYVGFYQANEPVLILRDPDLIKDVTIKEFDSFPNHKKFLPPNVDLLWERNLFQMSTEEGWHTMRATLSPSFTSSKMKMLFNLMRDCSTEFVKYFQSQKGEIVVELKDTFTRFTNDIIATSAFGIQCNSLKDRTNKFYLMGKEATDSSGLKGLKFFGFVFSPLLMKLFNIKIFSEKVSNFFKGVIKETVTYRQLNNVVRPDMLHLLLEASKKLKNSDEDKKSNNIITEFSLDDITAQAVIFFTAGFDTVSSAMCYLAYELSIHPEIQDKLYNEIKETLKDTPQLTYESITTMKYLECCISESLRVHPPVPVVDRQCQKSYTINPIHSSEKQIRMEKGQMVWIPICALHHDEKYFSNPLKFDPERFNDENRPKINPSVYVPFGTGPRMCIGSRFAIMEIKLILVEILRHFEIVVNKQTKIPLNYSVTNFNGIPDDGICLSFKPRVLH